MIDQAEHLHQLPGGLRVPIGARSLDVITHQLGRTETIAGHPPDQVRLVHVDRMHPGPVQELRLGQEPRAHLLTRKTQVWVHVDYGSYADAYFTVFPEDQVSGNDVDHVLSGGFAAERGYPFVRLQTVKDKVNRGAGGSFEKSHCQRIRTDPRTFHQAKLDIAFASHLEVAKILNLKGWRGNRNGSGGHGAVQQVEWLTMKVYSPEPSSLKIRNS